VPISITITANNAAEAAQLVHDLADTISRMSPDDIPEHTEVSTVNPAPSAPVTPPTSAQAAAPQTSATVPVTPAAPTVVPTAVPSGTSAAPITPPTSSAAPTAPATAPTTAPQYDFNQLATATMQLQQAGQNIFELFQQFGIQALNQLPKERYAEYAAVLRQRGAKI